MGDEIFYRFGCGEKFPCDVFGAFDNNEGALWVPNNNITLWHILADFLRPLRQLQTPLIAETDKGREKGKKDGGEKGHAIFKDDGEA